MDKILVIARCVNQSDKSLFENIIKVFQEDYSCDYILFDDFTKKSLKFNKASFNYTYKEKYHTIPEFLSEIESNAFKSYIIVNFHKSKAQQDYLKVAFNVFKIREVQKH